MSPMHEHAWIVGRPLQNGSANYSSCSISQRQGIGKVDEYVRSSQNLGVCLLLLVDPGLGAKGPLTADLRLRRPWRRLKSMSWESLVEAANMGVDVMALACDLFDSAAKQRVIVSSKVSLGSRKRCSFKARLCMEKMILYLIMLSAQWRT